MAHGGGGYIVEKLGDRLQIPVVHGDTLTSATVIKQAKQLLHTYRIDSPVFITGATSKIGRSVALALIKERIPVVMHTKSEERFAEIRGETDGGAQYLSMDSSFADAGQCKLWITGKAIPFGKKLLRHIPLEATVVNFSVPNPIPEKLYRLRPDVRFIEGGMLAYDPSRTDLQFTMRLTPGITYACHAGTMVHAYKGWKHHEVSHVDMARLTDVWEAAQELGFYLPPIDT